MITLGVLVLALIVAAVLYFNMQNNKKDVAMNTNVPEKTKEIVKTDVETNKSPEKFPTDIPIESGATITQNYNATAPDGRFQATRAFTSKKTLGENYALYKEWMNSNGWTIASSVDQPTYKMVSGTKGKQTLQASISENSSTKEVTVTLSLTILP